MTAVTTSPRETALGLVNDIAADLEALADPIDTGQRPPSSAYALIRESGLLAALIPTDRGGLGLDFADYTEVLAHIGAANGALALGYNMHNVAIGSLFDADADALGSVGSAFRDWVVDEIIRGKKLFASAASEYGNGARLRGITTTYRSEPDHFVINGRKSFVSLAGVADYYVVTARPQDAENDFEVSHFVVAGTDQGVSFDAQWNGTALAGTSTAAMYLTDTEIPRERLFLGVEGMSLFKAVREPHWMAGGYLGAYLGLASAIVDFVTGRVDADDHRRTDPATIAALGSMTVDLAAARALTMTAARAVTQQRSQTPTNALVYAAKYHLGVTAQSLAARAVQLTGSAAMAADTPMQRLVREVQFCSIMPAKPADCLSFVGRVQLGANMFDVSNHGW
ncbi:MAG: acyl-CoA dehydrogenase family protein [Gordonia sp. (in: high G+C Gram-positive bacteria)]